MGPWSQVWPEANISTRTKTGFVRFINKIKNWFYEVYQPRPSKTSYAKGGSLGRTPALARENSFKTKPKSTKINNHNT